MIKEISSEHVKIKKYNELIHCGMDIEEFTVLLTFNNVEEVKEFLDTHKGKNRVKMVEGDKVVKHNYCEGCEEIGY